MPLGTAFAAIATWLILHFSLTARTVAAIAIGSIPHIGNLYVLFTCLLVASLLLYAYIDLKAHKLQLKLQGVDHDYRIKHYLKFVMLPRIKYHAIHHWQRPAYWTAYGTASILLFAGAVDMGARPALASTGPGYAWKRVGDGRTWGSVALSADGSKIAALDGESGHIWYASSDGGATFVRHSDASVSGRKILMSDDGIKIAILGNTTVSWSIDSGGNWTHSPVPWSGTMSEDSKLHPVMSGDGNTLVVAAVHYSGNARLYVSSDMGQSWIEQNNAAQNRWRDLAASSDTMKLAATVGNNVIYTGSDQGATWTERDISGSWDKYDEVASSADGTRLVIAKDGGSGSTMMSSDGGATWVKPAPITPTGSPSEQLEEMFENVWRQDTLMNTDTDSEIASSADGMTLIRASGEISVDAGMTWVQQAGIGHQRGNVAMSKSGQSFVFSPVETYGGSSASGLAIDTKGFDHSSYLSAGAPYATPAATATKDTVWDKVEGLCGLSSGTLYCADQRNYARWNAAGGVLSGKTVTDMSDRSEAIYGAYRNICAVADGAVYCQGKNTHGEMGTNEIIDVVNGATTQGSSTMTPVDATGALSGKTITKVYTSRPHTCALSTDGQLFCWGTSNGIKNATPTAMNNGALSGKIVTDVSLYSTEGGAGGCAITTDNSAACWGGVLPSDESSGITPVAVDTSGVLSGKTLSNITAAGVASCVTANVQVYCWGKDYGGILGINPGFNQDTFDFNNPSDASEYQRMYDIDNLPTLPPAPVDTSGPLQGKTIVDLYAVSAQQVSPPMLCALADDGTVACWGSAVLFKISPYAHGAWLGDMGGTAPRQVAMPPSMNGVVLKSISNHGTFTHYGIDTSGHAYTWGSTLDASTQQDPESKFRLAIGTSGTSARRLFSQPAPPHISSVNFTTESGKHILSIRGGGGSESLYYGDKSGCILDMSSSAGDRCRSELLSYFMLQNDQTYRFSPFRSPTVDGYIHLMNWYSNGQVPPNPILNNVVSPVQLNGRYVGLCTETYGSPEMVTAINASYLGSTEPPCYYLATSSSSDTSNMAYSMMGADQVYDTPNAAAILYRGSLVKLHIPSSFDTNAGGTVRVNGLEYSWNGGYVGTWESDPEEPCEPGSPTNPCEPEPCEVGSPTNPCEPEPCEVGSPTNPCEPEEPMDAGDPVPTDLSLSISGPVTLTQGQSTNYVLRTTNVDTHNTGRLDPGVLNFYLVAPNGLVMDGAKQIDNGDGTYATYYTDGDLSDASTMSYLCYNGNDLFGGDNQAIIDQAPSIGHHLGTLYVCMIYRSQIAGVPAGGHLDLTLPFTATGEVATNTTLRALALWDYDTDMAAMIEAINGTDDAFAYPINNIASYVTNTGGGSGDSGGSGGPGGPTTPITPIVPTAPPIIPTAPTPPTIPGAFQGPNTPRKDSTASPKPRPEDSPHITFTEPYPGQGFKTGKVIGVSVTVTSTKPIKEVVFSLDGKPVGTVPGKPGTGSITYTHELTDIGTGAHLLTAVATDIDDGTVATAPVSFFVNKDGIGAPAPTKANNETTSAPTSSQANTNYTPVIATLRTLPWLILAVLALIYAVQAWRQEHQNRLLRKTIQLRAQTKTGIDGFLHIVSHYLRTPITIIDSALGLLPKSDASATPRPLIAAVASLKQHTEQLVQGVETQTAALANALPNEVSSSSQTAKNRSMQLWVILPIAVSVVLLGVAVAGSLGLGIWSAQRDTIVFSATLIVGCALLMYVFYRLWQHGRQLHANLEATLAVAEKDLAQRQQFISDNAPVLADHVSTLHASRKDLPDQVGTFIDTGLESLDKLVTSFTSIVSLVKPPTSADPATNITSPLTLLLRNIQTQASSVAVTYAVPEGMMSRLSAEEAQYIVSSLTDNALQFTPEGGKIHIAVSQLGKRSVIRVTDTGPGVAPDKLATLMQPFSRATDTETYDYEGIGLTLYTVRLIAEKYGGSVQIQNSSTSGALVTVRI